MLTVPRLFKLTAEKICRSTVENSKEAEFHVLGDWQGMGGCWETQTQSLKGQLNTGAQGHQAKHSGPSLEGSVNSESSDPSDQHCRKW